MTFVCSLGGDLPRVRLNHLGQTGLGRHNGYGVVIDDVEKGGPALATCPI
jgi:hypothetical protein